MSRCVACNKILKTNELLNTNPNTRDLCRQCIGSAFSEYTYTNDKEYAFRELEIDGLTKLYTRDTMQTYAVNFNHICFHS